MTKYLETKINSIEEAISSVVKGEGFASDAQRRAAFAQGYKAKGKKDKKEEIDEKFSITLPPVRGGKKLLNIEMGRAIRMLKDFGATKSDIRNVLSGKGGRFQNAGGEMFFVQRESVELGEAKYEVQYTVGSRVGDSRSRTKSRLSKIDIDARSKQDAEDKFFKQAEKSPMMRDAMRRDMLDVVYVGLKESLDEGYESEVLKVLKDADIEGYFKMGKLYVSRRDAKDAKKALEDSDEITKLPKMVMEDERMKKLTPRQRQALARVQAKPKSQVSLPKMPDFMKLKKEENEMDIVDTIRNVVEKKLDPVNKDAVKKKFDDRKDKDIDNDGDVDSTDKYLHKRRKAISKAIAKDNNEAYDIGKDYAQHTLEVTPGQDKKDVDKMLNVAYTKNQSMRESLAKVWGLDEGKSPFQKEEEKPLTKTMTGQKPTTVKVNPKIEEK